MKKFLALILGLILLASLAACGTSPPETGKTTDPVKIAVISANWANTFHGYLNAGFRYWDEQYDNIEVTLYDGENDQAKQNDKVDVVLNQGIDVLIICLVDSDSASTVIEKCRAADVPVVFYTKMPTAEDLQSYDKSLFVGVTTENQGRLQGVFLEEAINSGKWDTNGDGVLQYVLLEGKPGHSDVVERKAGLEQYIEEKGLACELLDVQSANWDTAAAKDIMEAWLGKYGTQIEFIISQNDAMALGAVEALKAAGYNDGEKMIPIIGVNALPEISDLIQTGYMFGTVLTDPTSVAQAAIDCAIRAAEGGTYETWTEGTAWVINDDKSIRIEDTVITKENVQIAIDAYKVAYK